MASKTFAINRTPHEATIGDVTLRFQPEIVGAVFMAAYGELSEAQKRVTAAGDNAGSEEFATISRAMKTFLSKLMLPESVDTFAAMQLPDRVLVQLIEWTAELFGGSTGKDVPIGPSSGS